MQQRYLANAVNDCATYPSYGKKVNYHYNISNNRKSMLHPIAITFSDLDKNSCKVSKRSG